MQQLLNPFAQKYPDVVDATLVSSANCARFNPSGPFAGHYLATGELDGLVQVWDTETRGVARVLEGHVKTVSSVCWSRNNRYLLSASLDSTAIIWDLSVLPTPSLIAHTPITEPSSSASSASSSRLPPTQRVRTIRFDAPLAAAELHPRNGKIILATLTCNEVVLVDLRSHGSRAKLEDVMDGEEQADEEMQVDGEQQARDRKKGSLACAVFSPCGSRIYAGTTRGLLLIIDPVTRYVTQRIEIATTAIRQIAFGASGRYLITSSTDRALRVLRCDPLTGLLSPTHRFQDAVNRTPWLAAGFSGDGEYVMGGAGHKAGHNVYIWDRDSGALVKVLEGPKEPLVDCDWHPTRPIIASVGTSGEVHIWQTSSPDNWAAFAPGFEELEENVEYDEREDEFDIEDETDFLRRKDAEEDLIIDVLTPDDSFPRRPAPLLTLPSNIPAVNEDGVESEAAAAVRSAIDVARWAEEEPDEDEWEGFFLSLDLLVDGADEENGL